MPKRIKKRVPSKVVLRLPDLDHAKSADRYALHKDVSMLNRTIGQDANVRWIPVTFERPPRLFRRERRDLVSAEGLGNEAIQSGADIRILLGPVDLEIP